MVAYVTGAINQELLLKNEYLVAENRMLRAKVKGRLVLSREEKVTLADIAHRLGRKALREMTSAARPETILGWYQKLIARKFDGSNLRQRAGRPKITPEIENLVMRMARENPGWGYDRIVGALANLGHLVSDQTAGNILKRHGIAPAPKRKQTIRWNDFIRSHMAVLAGTDFFTVELLTLKGLVTYYVLFFIHLESRRICIAGMTPYPDEEWMNQRARNVTLEGWGFLNGCQYVLHDRDTKFCQSFRQTLKSGNVETIRLPAKSPNLNAYAERWVRSIKEECLSKLILFGERSLEQALRQYQVHYHEERNHQGKQNRLLVPRYAEGSVSSHPSIRCKERLGGLLKYYHRQAA